MNQVDPQKNKRKESKQKSKEALGKLGIDLATLDLSEHEEIIASEVVSADEIQVTFNGVWFFFFLPLPLATKTLDAQTVSGSGMQTSAVSIRSSPSSEKPSSSRFATRNCSRARQDSLARQRESCSTVRPVVER